MKSHRYSTVIIQELHRDPTVIIQELHRDPTVIIQELYRKFSWITKKIYSTKTMGVVRRGWTQGGEAIPAAETVVMCRPYPPCLSFAFFCDLVFLVFLPRHCRLLRFLF